MQYLIHCDDKVKLGSFWFVSGLSFIFKLHWLYKIRTCFRFLVFTLLESLVNRSSVLLCHSCISPQDSHWFAPRHKDSISKRKPILLSNKARLLWIINIGFVCSHFHLHISMFSSELERKISLNLVQPIKNSRGVLENTSTTFIASLSYWLACGKNHYKATVGEACKF